MDLLCRGMAKTVSVTILAPSRSRRRVEDTLDGVRRIRVPEFGRYASVPLCPSAPFELNRLKPDIVHLHFPNPMGDLALLLGGSHLPFVITYHADIIRQKRLVPLYQPVIKTLFNRTRKIIFSAAENIPDSPVIAKNRHKCAVIPFGIRLEDFRLRNHEEHAMTALRGELKQPIVSFVGATRYYKGLDVLLRAMVHLRANLILAGRGTQNAHLRRMAADLGITDRVQFRGEISQSDLRVLLNAADIFALPSIDRSETFGLGQLEAMACGKPVVSTDLPTGVRSVNKDGVTGLVVPPGDSDALAGALNLLISKPGLCTKLGDAARQRVERKFNANQMVSKTLETYCEALKSGQSNRRILARQ